MILITDLGIVLKRSFANKYSSGKTGNIYFPQMDQVKHCRTYNIGIINTNISIFSEMKGKK